MRILVCALMFCLAPCITVNAQDVEETKEVIRIAVQDGQLNGRVFAELDDERAPVLGKVSLTNEEGKTISTSQTDEDGNFSFTDVEPGTYKAIGIAGDYVGDAQIEVTEEEESTEGYYTAIPLAVAPAQSGAIFNSYSSLPAASFAQGPVFGGGSFSGGCSSCGGGCSGGCGGGAGLRSFGGGCGSCGGGLNFRRLALLAGAVAIPIAISGGDDDPASPAAL